jgi:sigma-B regulation protein RsbU (phosphoserine phosphatase)
MLDVSGHGVQAAMITVSVAQFLQPNSGHLHRSNFDGSTSIPHLKTPAEVLTALDDEFPFERFNNFFTITYMILNTNTGELSYSNAGHPHSIVIRNGGELELLSKGGPAIGMGEFHLLSGQAERFEEGRPRLQPGDRLFIYTDGIIEHQRPDGEFFGTKRFCKTLQALQGKSIDDMIDQAIYALLNFGNNTKPEDDITLLGLEFKESK